MRMEDSFAGKLFCYRTSLSTRSWKATLDEPCYSTEPLTKNRWARAHLMPGCPIRRLSCDISPTAVAFQRASSISPSEVCA